MKNIMLFGGSFDPFHNGHFRMIEKAITHFNIEEFVIIPNFVCPNKDKPLISCEDRLSVLKSLLDELPQRSSSDLIKYSVSDIEIKQQKLCYTIDTLHKLKKEGLCGNLYLLIGSDNFFNFHLWKSYKEILNQVTLCVIRRDNIPVKTYEDYIYDQLHQHEFTAMVMIGKEPMNLSSTQIKDKVRNNEKVSELVPKKVLDFIKSHKGLFK